MGIELPPPSWKHTQAFPVQFPPPQCFSYLSKIVSEQQREAGAGFRLSTPALDTKHLLCLVHVALAVNEVCLASFSASGMLFIDLLILSLSFHPLPLSQCLLCCLFWWADAGCQPCLLAATHEDGRERYLPQGSQKSRESGDEEGVLCWQGGDKRQWQRS